jgi:hypothetical protein
MNKEERKMASNGDSKSGLLTAGGVLSIIAGVLEVIGGVIISLLTLGVRMMLRWEIIPPHPGDWWGQFIPVIPFWLFILGIPIFALGIVAIVGGAAALKRKSFGLSLAGAICALPSILLGILAVIFVSVSKREFEEKD